jgi:protein-L-isoaspartate(D-aspartate) O-methyltransferase
MLRPITLALLAWSLIACKSDQKPPPAEHHEPAPPDPIAEARNRMVDETIAARGVTDPKVLEAMRTIPRDEFVPLDVRDRAYEDSPQPIGFGLTISQPYIVAVMSAAAHIKPGDKVLEIGTGSGYQAAVLSELGAKVYSIEIVEPLAKRTQKVLANLGFNEIHVRIGDGYFGWREEAPFAAIIVTTAPAEIPLPLIEQLAVGGRMVIPVGTDEQYLKVITRGPSGNTEEELMGVRFSHMTGESQNH